MQQQQKETQHKWQKALRHNITSIEELKDIISIPEEQEKDLASIVEKYPMCITPHYLSLINPHDIDDPIRKMCVPSIHELSSSGRADTSGEACNTMMSGLQHKYKQTVLLLSSNICAMYCRHCFRKRMVGLTNEEIMRKMAEAVNYINDHPEVNNVLISGGDSFMLSTKIIQYLLEELSSVRHLSYIRFGTRTPVVHPERMLLDDELLKVLSTYSTPSRRILLHTQFNHPREINWESIEAIKLLLKSGVIVNNQTVLLRGVNDDPKVMATLQRSLVSIGVNPYYVFQCRPVKGVKSHFQVPLAEGIKIIDNTRLRLDGVSKRFRYAMSHEKGKVEIIGIIGNEMYFKHQQAKDPADANLFFKRKVNDEAGWLDELEE